MYLCLFTYASLPNDVFNPVGSFSHKEKETFFEIFVSHMWEFPLKKHGGWNRDVQNFQMLKFVKFQV